MYPPPRSAIPRVIGIIAMPLAAIGLGGSLLFTFGPLHDIRRWGLADRLDGTVSWLYLWLAISFVLFAVHLAGAIASCLYKPIGPRLMVGYATGALLLLGIDLVMMWGFMPTITEHDVKGSVAIARTVFEAIALPWPVLVLAFMTSRSARTACAQAGPQQYMYPEPPPNHR